MNISLDYDETYSADPLTWRRVVRTLMDAGHNVRVVTMRHPHEISTICPLLRSMVEVIPTGRKAKRPFCEARGIQIDIWIDDSPHWVDNDIPHLYAYGISSVNASGEEGPPTKWVFPQVVSGLTAAINLSWDNQRGSAFYKIYGRKAGKIGLLTTIPAGTTMWTDDGSAEPTTQPPNLMSELPIRYNTLRSLEVRVEFSDRQNVVV